MRRTILLALLLFGVAGQRSFAQPTGKLELVPLSVGIRESSFGADESRFRKTPMAQAAAAAGIDVRAPDHPLIQLSFRRQRLFYVFYNRARFDTEHEFVFQRIKKVVRNEADEEPPEVETSYLVEAIKLADGVMKRPDQHFGSFSLGQFERRSIVKEFEVGTATLTGVADGPQWPFLKSRLFKQLQPYQSKPGVYERVDFKDSVRWTLRIEFDRDGNFEFDAPELGLQLRRKVPPGLAIPTGPGRPGKPDPESAHIVLVAGDGTLGLQAGTSTLAQVRETLGPPLQTQPTRGGAANHWHSRSLTFNVRADDVVNTIMTRPGFLGQSQKGIKHGDTRQRVAELYGQPIGRGRSSLTFPGIVFWFDQDDRVTKIVIFGKPAQSQ